MRPPVSVSLILTSCLVEFGSYRRLLIKFWTHCVLAPLGSLEATYTVNLIRLIGKFVVDFIFVLIKDFR